jgi:hypothetical protein
MNKNLKLAFCSILILFAFASCQDDDIEVADKSFEISINGTQIVMDLNADGFTSGFNVQSFNYIDNIATEEDPETVETYNRASIDTEDMMFAGSTVEVNYFSFFNVDKSMDYEAGEIDMSLTVNKIDAFNQILDADFSGTFTDINSGETVTVSGSIKFN